MQICPTCAEENPDKFRLCGFCGTPLSSQTGRKIVTVVFTDLKGSTSLGSQIDGESMWEMLGLYFDAMKTVVERHGGSVEKYIGDAIMAVFGLSQAHEDDALRAVRTAVEMQTALVEVNEKLHAGWGVRLENRTGVNTGEVVVGDPGSGQRLVSGDAVNVAARLEQAAPTNEVLIGESTYRLVQHAVDVEPLEPLELKGKPHRVPAYRMIGIHGGDAIPRRSDTPMVGRERELASLRALFQRAVESGTCHVATILGQPGLGKSRLVAELGRDLAREATILHGRCLSYGDGTFWPLAEVVRQASGISDDNAANAHHKLAELLGEQRSDAVDRLASLIGLSPNLYSLEETQWAARVLLEVLARRHPLVVVFDDLHWAEPSFLDLVESLAETSRGAPLLLICAARPELLDSRPEWMDGRARSSLITLEELSVADSALVVRNLLGETGLPRELELRILSAAEGNPLFVEQVIAMIVEDGTLVDAAGRRMLGDSLGLVAVPASIASLLAARLDRLSAQERSVLERGSIIGQVFYQSALDALSDGGQEPGITATLASLARKRLVARAESDIDLFEGDAWQFVHILVRDAAYRGLLKRSRARLHERFGNWLASLAATRLAEYDEIVGYHLEQAFNHFGELGELGAEGRTLGERAAAHLDAAGTRALARSDMPAAASLLHRAANLLPDDGPARPRLLLEVGDALTEVGELTQAGNVLGEAVERASSLGDEALASSARLALLYLRYSTDPRGVEAPVVEEADSAIAAFSDPEDHEVLGRAWRLLMSVYWNTNMFGPADEAVSQVIRHAAAAGDALRARRTLGAVAMCAVYGPSPVPEAIARCTDVLTKAAEDRKVTALAQCAIARLEAMSGAFDRARNLYQQSRATLEEFGWSLLAALTSIDSGPIEMLAGDPEAAERELRRDFETLREMDEHNYISTVAALMAEALYEQGRFDEADAFAGTAAELGSPDDGLTQYVWRCVRAKLLARQGCFSEAEALATEAVSLIDGTDFLDAQGSARLDLAEVYALAGKQRERESTLAEAGERFERKGNIVALASTRSLLATSGVPLSR